MGAITRITYSSHFERALKKLPRDILAVVDDRVTFFRTDCFHPSLKTHKLKGYPDLWAFSLTYEYRIVFRFLSGTEAYLIEAGDHSIYQ